MPEGEKTGSGLEMLYRKGIIIYKDDQYRKTFLIVLTEAVEKCNWYCQAYCLMDNHYHLLIETPKANLSYGMRQLNGVYWPWGSYQATAGLIKIPELFSDLADPTKEERNYKTSKAHLEYGYTLKESADSIGVHYTTVSKIVRAKK